MCTILWAAGCREASPEGEPDAGIEAGVDAGADAACADRDGDGHGDVACGGDDCNDANPQLATMDDCRERCGADPHYSGCPCATEAPESCYDGPAETGGVGECSLGVRHCDGGSWSSCEGARFPGPAPHCLSAGGDWDCDGQPDPWCACPGCSTCLGRDCLAALSSAEWRGLAPSGDEPECVTLAAPDSVGVLETIFQRRASYQWWKVVALASTPEGSSLRFSVRCAADPSGLADQPWELVGTLPDDPLPFDLPDCRDSWLGMRVDFEPAGPTGPTLCGLAAIAIPPGE